MPPPRSIVGSGIAIVGVLVALNGIVAGPRTFGFGWYAVIGLVLAGLLILLCGLLLCRSSEHPD